MLKSFFDSGSFIWIRVSEMIQEIPEMFAGLRRRCHEYPDCDTQRVHVGFVGNVSFPGLDFGSHEIASAAEGSFLNITMTLRCGITPINDLELVLGV